eukprot:TRINITY_DN1775_c0_g3_i1.p1 TRINITY_DN1775_c0_g3~~TRINITY_DN1775_c0_g3_i1.p1  ORF type:complete len:284 (-),score=17.57 TRINITY_DN1775_c0_g3_i1:124-975(-)
MVQLEYIPPSNIDERLREFQGRREINEKFMPALYSLGNYDIVYICDDSGSMSLIADDDAPQNGTRWFELKQSVQIVLEAHEAVGLPTDIYFLNRGTFRNVQRFSDVERAFSAPPSGSTNIVKILRQVFSDRVSSDYLERPLIIHIFTDGHPTNDMYREDISGLMDWLRFRPNINNTFISFILCTDDEAIESSYRPMEYRVRGQLGWTGPTQGIPGVDVTEDYRGELRDVRRLRGNQYYFSYGDYIVKCLLGCVNAELHMIDLPNGISIYSDDLGCNQVCCIIL